MPVRRALLIVFSLLAATSLAQTLKPSDMPKTDAEDPSKKVTFSAEPGKGFAIKTADDRYSLNIRARMQLRDTLTFFPSPPLNEVQVRTLRLYFGGTVLSPNIRYLIQLAFGGGDFDRETASPIFDAFVEYVRFRDLQLRVGQFFVPFDRARTVREYALQFVDRQQVVRELTLDRDVGVMLSSNDFLGLHEHLGYNLFVGGGDGRNRFTAVGVGPLIIGRLTWRPFGLFDDDLEGDLTRDKRPRLAWGVAGGANFQTSKPMSTTGTPFTAGTTNYWHAATDLVFKWHGLSFLGEFVWRRASVDEIEKIVAGNPVIEPTRSGYGYLLQAGYMVTSKFELAARWEQLFALRGTDPKLIELAQLQGRQVGMGANLYLNGHAFKIQGDFFYTFGTQGVARTQARLQLDATF